MSLQFESWTPTGGTHKFWSPEDPNRYGNQRGANGELGGQVKALSDPLTAEPKKVDRKSQNKHGQEEYTPNHKRSVLDKLYDAIHGNKGVKPKIDVTG